MTIAATPGTALDWVTFEDFRSDEVCGYRTDPCSRQATHAGVFRLMAGTCGLYSDRIPYCLAHTDLLLRQSVRNYGLFCCPHGSSCVIALLVRMEALR